MFVSIRRYRVEGSVQELTNRIENGLVPIFKKNPEFTAYYLVGGHDDHIATVSVFNSFDAALKSNLEAASWVKENVREFMPEDAQVTSGETLIEVQAAG